MSEESQHRARALFNEALEIPDPTQREAFLARACVGDEPLRQKLEQLLLAYAAAGDFLANRSRQSILNYKGPHPTAVAEPGTRIGRYKLLEPLGEGGCGIVFLAEQEEPVRRQVALKVIKLGMDTKSVIARFEAERQALAMMDHPSIARIFDAGATETGRPYFVMELVRGLKITEYCDQNHLTTPQRLHLFIQVCQAVQHQKGIIHRDLKPSNILVSLHDGRSTPKIIDFGIAKATQARLTDQTLFTSLQQFIGTPAYVSPEQATMTSLDIDTRSDIYSLGVLLYELLTGKTSFDSKQLAQGGLDAMRRIIREDEPQRPSTRLRALPGEELTTTARRRQTDVLRLLSVLTGDLDWVVMKCLEKDRARRYETANGLAMDLERFIAQETVTARPPTAAYQIGKLLRRHKLAFAAAGTILVVLLAGIVVSSLEAARARRAEREQQRLRKEADFKVYAQDMYRANESIRSGNLGRARDMLEKYRPKPGRTDLLDLRGWEWRFLWPQCQSEARFQLSVSSNADAICSLAVSADEKWLAVGEDEDGGLSVWDLERRREVARPSAGNQRVLVSFSPRQSLLAFAGANSPAAFPSNSWVRFWASGSSVTPPELPLEGFCNGLAFTPDGRTLVTSTAGGAGKITLWQIPEGNIRTDWAAPQRDNIAPDARTTFALSHDGTMAAYISKEQRVSIIDLRTGRQQLEVRLHANEDSVRSLGFSPDGKVLAVAPGFGAFPVRLYDLTSGHELNELRGHGGAITALVFAPDSRSLIGGSSDSSIYIWNLGDPGAQSGPKQLHGHRDDVWSLASLPDQHTLISGSKSGEIYGWDLTEVQPQCSRFTLPVPVARWGFATSGQAVVTLEMSGRCAQWSGPDFEHSQTLVEVGSNLINAWFSPDRRAIAVLYPHNLIRVFDLLGHGPNIDLPGAGESEFALRFLPNGKALFVIRMDGSLREWDLATRREVGSWQGAARLEAGDISRDGRLFLTLGYGAEVSLYDLTMGNDVIYIGYLAFDNCVSLASILIPQGVTKILLYSFAGTVLTSVTIPNNVTTINSGAFDSCLSLKSAVIGSSVTDISILAFSKCSALTEITVDGLNPVYSSVEGAVYNKNKTALIIYPNGKEGGYTIPNTMSEIGAFQFDGCVNLTSVTIPSSVTTIWDYAFRSCISLTRLTFPDSVTIISDYAFMGCYNLVSVTFPNSLTKIGESAFDACASLTTVAIPRSVTSIITSFNNCPALTEITVDPLNSVYSSLEGVLFDKSQTTLIECPAGKSGNYTIPIGVNRIGVQAFFDCSRLTSVTFPDSVFDIEFDAFQYCRGLTSVALAQNVSSIKSWAFADCPNLKAIYFKGNAPRTDLDDEFVFINSSPDLKVYYMAGTTGWGRTFARRPTALWNPQVKIDDAMFGVGSNQFGFNITGTMGPVIVVEASTNLGNSFWIPVGTNTLVNGSSHFSDPLWTNYPSRFYRLRWP